MKSFSQRVFNCLLGFDELCSAIEADQATPPRVGISLAEVSDQLSRFKVWSANIGAHKTGRSSLEFRLRDASHLQRQAIDLLEDLGQSLHDARDIFSGNTEPWEAQLPMAVGRNADPDPDTDSDPEPKSEPEMPPELFQILTSIIENVNCLLRLSMSIRNPAPHDRFKQSTITDTTHFQLFDVQHVRTKYPSASDVLVQRLGTAISRRRQYFRYRDLRRQKMASGLDPWDTNDGLQSTVASSSPEQMKMPHIDINDNISDSAPSQTSLATTIPNGARPKMPALPEAAQQGPFECPLCFMMVFITTGRAWKEHVFADLRPYICLSPDCPAPDQDFERRHQWADHVQSYHWKTWICNLGCNSSCMSEVDMRRHLYSVHARISNSVPLDGLLSVCEWSKPLNSATRCPLCDEVLNSFKSYQQHVGRHQEDLALFALPKLNADEENLADVGVEEGEKEVTEAVSGRTSQQDANFQDNASQSMESPSHDISPLEVAPESKEHSEDGLYVEFQDVIKLLKFQSFAIRNRKLHVADLRALIGAEFELEEMRDIQISFNDTVLEDEAVPVCEYGVENNSHLLATYPSQQIEDNFVGNNHSGSLRSSSSSLAARWPMDSHAMKLKLG
ncbi:hypothetical protein S40293_10134 [Stachybotrys chartarum IBT 40293]|nr:hypothetical protein S40293_10134 [Stachybotrys chartarum IBT 40293]